MAQQRRPSPQPVDYRVDASDASVVVLCRHCGFRAIGSDQGRVAREIRAHLLAVHSDARVLVNRVKIAAKSSQRRQGR